MPPEGHPHSAGPQVKDVRVTILSTGKPGSGHGMLDAYREAYDMFAADEEGTCSSCSPSVYDRMMSVSVRRPGHQGDCASPEGFGTNTDDGTASSDVQKGGSSTHRCVLNAGACVKTRV